MVLEVWFSIEEKEKEEKIAKPLVAKNDYVEN